MKKLFLFSISVTLLFTCGAITVYIWKREQIAMAKELAKKQKRLRLDKHYVWEFKFNLSEAMNHEYDTYVRGLAWEDIKKTEDHMVQDGYDRAEIAEIRHQARMTVESYSKQK